MSPFPNVAQFTSLGLDARHVGCLIPIFQVMWQGIATLITKLC